MIHLWILGDFFVSHGFRSDYLRVFFGTLLLGTMARRLEALRKRSPWRYRT